MKDGWYEGRTECYSVRTDWQFFLRLLGVLLLAACPSVSAAAEVVRAELGKDTVWTGEAVPLIVTLYSPGPFSGTPAFDLPELPLTVFVKSGSPQVGTEQVDDESYFTQRHEFALYTQRVGEIAVPAFSVRFAGKKTFTSAPEPVEGLTAELRFQSKRPPGTDNLGVVVAVQDMVVSQSWKPASLDAVNAGDVIERTISRRATATTAMMFPPVPADAPDGVRVYPATAIVQDHTERGASRAERIETIKYQFERPGTFELPAVSLAWWDPQSSTLQRKTLPGETINVVGTVAATVAPAQPSSRRSPAVLLLTLLAIGLAAWLGRKPALRFTAAWQARRNNPEARAARRLLAACRAGDASAAYAALVDWKRAVSASDGGASLDIMLQSALGDDLQREWTVLSRRVFGVQAGDAPWSGRPLGQALVRARHGLDQTAHTSHAVSALPTLNPTASATRKVNS
jgi:hypothetical protein